MRHFIFAHICTAQYRCFSWNVSCCNTKCLWLPENNYVWTSVFSCRCHEV